MWSWMGWVVIRHRNALSCMMVIITQWLHPFVVSNEVIRKRNSKWYPPAAALKIKTALHVLRVFLINKILFLLVSFDWDDEEEDHITVSYFDLAFWSEDTVNDFLCKLTSAMGTGQILLYALWHKALEGEIKNVWIRKKGLFFYYTLLLRGAEWEYRRCCDQSAIMSQEPNGLFVWNMCWHFEHYSPHVFLQSGSIFFILFWKFYNNDGLLKFFLFFSWKGVTRTVRAALKFRLQKNSNEFFPLLFLWSPKLMTGYGCVLQSSLAFFVIL